MALCDPMDYSWPGSSVYRIFQHTEVGCYALLQGIFPTQGSNPGLPHYRQILYCLSHQGNTKILWYLPSNVFKSRLGDNGYKPLGKLSERH